MSLPELTVYSRRGCHLCEVLIDELEPLVRDRLKVVVRDIDTRPEWRAAYDTRVPVVEYQGQFVCQYQLDRGAIGALLRKPETETQSDIEPR